MTTHTTPDTFRRWASAFPAFDGLKEASKGREWKLGSLGVWKSDGEPVVFNDHRVPTYRRGSLVCDLPSGMHFAVAPFTLADDAPAFAVVMRSDDEELIGAWTLDAGEAARVAAFLNDELEALRRALPPPAA